MSGLETYRGKRNFRRTREPSGTLGRSPAAGGGLFVVHKHDARRLHYDLRLEHEGVLESWAVPKGPSLKVGEKRLAVHVEDHPLEYGEFEGTIPEKEYGGGTVMLWDRGNWREIRRGDGHIDFQLEGHKLYGTWTLTRMKGDDKGKENWLLIKRNDAASVRGSPPLGRVARERSVSTGRTMAQIARGEESKASRGAAGTAGADLAALDGARRAARPPRPRPQLATLVDEVPEGRGWIHEIKFDGYRILASLDDGRVILWSRNGKDWTDRFPAIAAALGKLPVSGALLDGEVVALERDGTSSFRRLQECLGEKRTDELIYQVFDLLYADGVDLRGVALCQRKRVLADLAERAGFVGSAPIRYTGHIEGDGRAFFTNACQLGLEGIVCKRADGRYRERRTRQWLKVKCSLQEELVVGGYTDPAGSRTGFGALLLGAYDESGSLVYAGKVGTGFSERQLATLHARLSRLETRHCSFATCPERRGVHWVRPALVAEVEFTEWTRDGRLRHPTFRGLREDKEPEDIRMPAISTPAPAVAERSRPAGRRRDGSTVAGVRLSHPDRVLFPDQGVSKLDLARYYEHVADWILPQLERRPLSLLRCPEGQGKACFFQKHPGQAISADLPRIAISEKEGKADYLYVEALKDLIALVQAGTLELHAWGCRVDRVERPDMLVFDLDPGPDVPWKAVLDATASLADRVEAIGLEAFVRTTGGKGMHVVVPLVPKLSWDEVKSFARSVAEAHAADDPRQFTVNMSKAKRRGRIFLDYLRNGRGATAIVSYSTRARKGAPVAVPVRRQELVSSLTSDRYDIEGVRRRLAALADDPWADFESARRPLTKRMLDAVAKKGGRR